MMNIGRYNFIEFSQDGWKGWCDGDFSDGKLALEDWLKNGQVILDIGCRKVQRHVLARGRVVYSKLMWAQNDGALAKRELFSWIKWAFGPSRSITILKNTAAMLDVGLLCPRPLLGVRKKMPGGRHLNLLVTEEITEPTVEQTLKAQPEMAIEAMTICGSELARLHRGKFIHGDFLPRNACINFSGKKLIFLDNDKTSRWAFKPPFFLQRRNLDQFVYNVLCFCGFKLFDTSLTDVFLKSYADSFDWDQAMRDAVSGAVYAKAHLRWENKKMRSKK